MVQWPAEAVDCALSFSLFHSLTLSLRHYGHQSLQSLICEHCVQRRCRAQLATSAASALAAFFTAAMAMLLLLQRSLLQQSKSVRERERDYLSSVASGAQIASQPASLLSFKAPLASTASFLSSSDSIILPNFTSSLCFTCCAQCRRCQLFSVVIQQSHRIRWRRKNDKQH